MVKTKKMERIAILFALLLGAVSISGQSQSLQDSVVFYSSKGLYARAIPFAEAAKEEAKKKGEQSQEYALSLIALGKLKGQAGKGKEGLEALKEGTEKQVLLGENHVEVALNWLALGNVYSDFGQFQEADSLIKKALKVLKTHSGENSAHVASCHYALGNHFSNMGNNEKAEAYMARALESRLNLLGEINDEVATSYSELGLLYRNMGNRNKAEEFALKSLSIRKKLYGENHPDVAVSYTNIGVLHSMNGRFSESDSCYRKAIDIYRKTLGEDHPTLALTYLNLGVLHIHTWAYLKAEAETEKGLEILLKTFKKDHAYFGSIYLNLAIINTELHRFRKAEEYYLRSLPIMKQTLGESSVEFAKLHGNLAVFYMKTGRYRKSEQASLKCLSILKKVYGPNHMDVGIVYSGLGQLYQRMSAFKKAEEANQTAIRIQKRAGGSQHPELLKTCSNAGLLKLSQKQMDKADFYFQKLYSMIRIEVSGFFRFMDETEKEAYAESCNSYISAFQAYCLMRLGTKPTVSATLYDQQLLTKAMLLNSSLKLKHRLRNATDTSLKSGFARWEALQSEIARQTKSTDSSERVAATALQQRAGELEKDLARRSEHFSKLTERQQITWKEVRSKLKPGEMAIEMVRIGKFGIHHTVTDSSEENKPVRYSVQDVTDSIVYAALLLTPSSPFPEVVVLPDGNLLEGPAVSHYQKCLGESVTDKASYNRFWKPVSDRIGKNIHRIYFSPDGVYNLINLNTLFNPKTGKHLLEEVDLHLLTNTKDLVINSPKTPNELNACLVGSPSYNLEEAEHELLVKNLQTPRELADPMGTTRNMAFAELPGTREEVETIAGILTQNKWLVSTYLGKEALEERLKSVTKPGVLHIATHGFFQTDRASDQNPLLRSGLILSGANRSASASGSKNMDDGILTAYEAMNLNLDNTDLVVLSACETGLGEIKNGEGVYGLQRAFKVAGAKSIIMSLWKVDDNATQELMVSFYEKWLKMATVQSPHDATTPEWALSPPSGSWRGKTSHNYKRAAFLAAQKDLKAKYPNPYYWGAFVMVGE